MYSYKIKCRKYIVPSVNITYKNINIKADSIKTEIDNIGERWRETGYLKKQEYIKSQTRKYIATLINNAMLHAELIDPLSSAKSRTAKTTIDTYSHTQIWDKTKILTNPYEFVYFTSRKYLPLNLAPIAALDPLSRSFFKMIEMANTGLQTLLHKKAPLTTLHLAEGPGGFIEAIIYLRQKYADTQGIADNIIKNDRYYGITLLNDNSFEVPSWKKSQLFIKFNPQLNILTGNDGTGNLYKTDNIRHLYYRFACVDNKPGLVTGDGGFDFSINHNLQEYNSSRLILAQILCALATIAKGGVFICKFFDIHSRITAECMYLLQCYFTDIYIYKPKTSRIANSEKYIICQDFHGNITLECLEPFLQILDTWTDLDSQKKQLLYKSLANKNIEDMQIKIINSIFNDDALPPTFIDFLKIINSNIVDMQITNINYTIRIIEGIDQLPDDWCKQMIITAVNWCNNNNIPISHTYL